MTLTKLKMHSKTKLTFETTRFGQLQVDEDKVIYFAEGLFGFPESKRYVLIDYKGTTIRWLQSVDDPEVAFIVIEPAKMFPNYDVHIDQATKKYLEIDNNEDGLAILLIIRVDEGKIIANLNGPLVFNANIMKGVQIVNEKVKIETNQRRTNSY